MGSALASEAGSAAMVVVGVEVWWTRLLLLAICIWAFCRAYYFAFYVIGKYIDPGYRFSGLASAVRHLLKKPVEDADANKRDEY